MTKLGTIIKIDLKTIDLKITATYYNLMGYRVFNSTYIGTKTNRFYMIFEKERLYLTV